MTLFNGKLVANKVNVSCREENNTTRWVGCLWLSQGLMHAGKALGSTSALTAGLLCDNSIMVKIKSSLLLAIHMKECAGKTMSDLYDKGFSVPSSLPEV